MSEADPIHPELEMATQAGLSARFSVDRYTIRRLLAQNEIRSRKVSDKRTVYCVKEFGALLAKYREEKKPSDLKDEIARQRARNLQIKNDQLEAKLIPRSEAVEAIRLMAGAVNGVRIRAEQEYPRLFAEAGDAIPANKLVLIQLFDDLFSQFREIGKTMETNK